MHWQADPQAFAAYLKQYNNTICGRHPIGILLHVSLPLCCSQFLRTSQAFRRKENLGLKIAGMSLLWSALHSMLDCLCHLA